MSEIRPARQLSNAKDWSKLSLQDRGLLCHSLNWAVLESNDRLKQDRTAPVKCLYTHVALNQNQ